MHETNLFSIDYKDTSGIYEIKWPEWTELISLIVKNWTELVSLDNRHSLQNWVYIIGKGDTPLASIIDVPL